MRQYYHLFEDNINKETVQELINTIHDKESVHLYISTDGGQTYPMYYLLDYLNSRHEEIEITLTDVIMSAGMLFLTDFKGKINLSEELVFIMAHKIDCEIYTLRKGYVNEKERIKQIVAENKELKEKLKKLGFTKKELKRFEQGKDVLLYKKNFHRLNINK